MRLECSSWSAEGGSTESAGSSFEGDMLDRCEISAVYLGSLASGPTYTYCSGDVRTTVDYILMDVESALMTTSCVTHEV